LDRGFICGGAQIPGIALRSHRPLYQPLRLTWLARSACIFRRTSQRFESETPGRILQLEWHRLLAAPRLRSRGERSSSIPPSDLRPGAQQPSPPHPPSARPLVPAPMPPSLRAPDDSHQIAAPSSWGVVAQRAFQWVWRARVEERRCALRRAKLLWPADAYLFRGVCRSHRLICFNPLPSPGIVVGAVHGRRGTRAATRDAPGPPGQAAPHGSPGQPPCENTCGSDLRSKTKPGAKVSCFTVRL